MLHASPFQFGATVAVVALVLAFRMRRMGQSRRLRVEQLWVVPAMFTVVVAVVLALAPPSLNDAPWLIGAALIGGVIGWYRGKVMRISVDPATHVVNQSASPWSMIFLLALIVIRYGARYALTEEAQAWNISLNVLTDAPLLLVVAMLTGARIEMYLRAQRLLQQARASKPDQAN